MNNNITIRHDESLTEAQKIDFRKSDAWKQFRQTKYDEQNGKDFITNQPLLPDYNCHHLCMKNNEYTNITDSSRFVALNRDTHSQVHQLFYTTDWKTTVTDENMLYVLNRMEELNDDIEVNLYRNAYTYTLINSNNKILNGQYASKLGIPTNEKGYIQWHRNYIPKDVPQETKAWVRYMIEKNGKDKALLIMELRHLNLYSSYKNFRNNPKMNQSVKNECLKELNTITELLRLYHKCFCNK